MTAPPEADLRLPGGLRLRPEELRFEFVRSGGPGGQNVNKVATKVVLRFDLLGSPSLPADARARLAQALASRLTSAGEIRISASEHRSQSRNRGEALARLLRLFAEALRPRRPRRPTGPTRGSVRRRLRAKALRSRRKRERGAGDED
ncbi:MAG TPA: alternative ribosome rescue aminoacyl-tRNA hydrolase ArfB [Planctomycetota bacterium]|jgi:ribosome-associated protein|nr:alternative ribosome rescue aminoacyl-tRNA hydrolase ArfB [Planctomycetota bacterium]